MLTLVDAASGGGPLTFAELWSTVLATAVALSSHASVGPGDAAPRRAQLHALPSLFLRRHRSQSSATTTNPLYTPQEITNQERLRAMEYIDLTPDMETRIVLIKTLSSVSAGKPDYNPTKYDKKVLETIGKKLKKNNVALDIVDFGETDDEKPEKLEALISAVNSNIIHVPPGDNAYRQFTIINYAEPIP
ncbi:hypothetical protein ABZP36_011006 [Zizania latifolia]